MNDIYIYNNSFNSLIALIVELVKLKIIPGNIKNTNYEKTLLDNLIKIEIEDENNNISQIKKYLTRRVISSIYYVFLSDAKDRELLIYNFLRYAIKYRDEVYHYRKIACINDTIKICKTVGGEAHKLKGFLRFREMENNFLYGEITPTNNVISILANHFKKRLAREIWIIKDKKRKIYAIYDTKNIYYLTDKDIEKLNLNINNKELFIEDLWKTFHKTIAIKERKNLKCQRNFMPKKYWKDMLEMEEYT